MANNLSPIFPRSFRTGDPLAPETQMGALVSREHMAKVLHYVAFARESGGVIHCGPDMPADYSKVSNRSETLQRFAKFKMSYRIDGLSFCNAIGFTQVPVFRKTNKDNFLCSQLLIRIRKPRDA